MQKLLRWCKDNWLISAVVFLLAFIPLYPKLPLIGVIRTWVYIRLEDIFVALAIAAFILFRLKYRSVSKSPLTAPIVTYWIIGMIVVIQSLIFIGPKLTGFFPHLAILHYLRRIEYMALFFLAFEAITRNRSHVRLVIWVLTVTTLLVVVYGAGQKFFGFPAYLTMNEEFAKGIPLRLPPTARIASTFAGHYDLAAYLVLTIPVFGSLVFGVKRLWQKIVFLTASVLSLVLLLLTASRISFGVYLIAISVMLVWQRKRLLIIPVIIVSFILLNYVSGASERFYKTFRFTDVIIDLSTGQPIGTLDRIEGLSAIAEKEKTPDEENLPIGSGFLAPSGLATAGRTVQTVEIYTSRDLATGSGEIATVSGSFLIQKAFVYDISITTRFQGQWPKAIAAFKRNILLGSGYSTLSLAADGDYLRMLGESGLMGTVAFLGVFAMAFALFFRNRTRLAPLPFAFVTGVFAGLVGLFFNAILIDVFEASKVAFTLWILLGVCVALLVAVKKRTPSYFEVLKRIFTSRAAYVFYLIIALFVVYGRVLPLYFLGDDFTWLRWAASSVLSDIPRYFTESSGFFYRPIPKLSYFILYTIFWLKPTAYHFVSLLLYSAAVVGIYTILVMRKIHGLIAWLASLLFAVLAIHHENVFWISGHSSLLAASMLFGALAFGMRGWEKRSRYSSVFIILSILFVFGSMLSHDSMLVAPIILMLVAWGLYRRPSYALVACLIPLYWWIRSQAHAVLPWGDYGYKLATFFPNVLGNGIGYFGSILFGPRVIEYFESVRTILRENRTLAGTVGVMFIILSVLGAWRIRKYILSLREAVVWFLCFILSLVAYLGLGGMAERNAFIASGFLILAGATIADRMWKKTGYGTIRFLMLAVISALIVWNVAEVQRVGNDWAKASEISETTLLALRRRFFPLFEPKKFIFVNVPIRYGRAWTFPTGLTDALWHVFVLNAYPHAVTSAESIEAGYAISVPLGIAREVLVFEDYKVKSALIEYQTIEDSN